jgi:hypothetical protein
MSGLVSKPLAIIFGLASSVAMAYLGMAVLAYVLAGGLENPGAGRAAVGDVTRVATGFLTAVVPGLIDLGQDVFRAAMDAVQS